MSSEQCVACKRMTTPWVYDEEREGHLCQACADEAEEWHAVRETVTRLARDSVARLIDWSRQDALRKLWSRQDVLQSLDAQTGDGDCTSEDGALCPGAVRERERYSDVAVQEELKRWMQRTTDAEAKVVALMQDREKLHEELTQARSFAHETYQAAEDAEKRLRLAEARAEEFRAHAEKVGTQADKTEQRQATIDQELDRLGRMVRDRDQEIQRLSLDRDQLRRAFEEALSARTSDADTIARLKTAFGVMEKRLQEAKAETERRAHPKAAQIDAALAQVSEALSEVQERDAYIAQLETFCLHQEVCWGFSQTGPVGEDLVPMYSPYPECCEGCRRVADWLQGIAEPVPGSASEIVDDDEEEEVDDA